jgi:cytoskeleton protein RodZ
VSGKPPFQIVIGNAAKVELRYDDRQIDLKPYTRAEVARLTLE